MVGPGFHGGLTYNYRPRSCGRGNIFTPVCHSVHRGGEVSASVHAGIPHTPPWTRHPPGTRHLPGPDTPWTRHPPGPDTPRPDPPGTRPPPAQFFWGGGIFFGIFLFGFFVWIFFCIPREADSGIWSTSSRYASYWNAFLFGIIFAENCKEMKENWT